MQKSAERRHATEHLIGGGSFHRPLSLLAEEMLRLQQLEHALQRQQECRATAIDGKLLLGGNKGLAWGIQIGSLDFHFVALRTVFER